MSIDEILSNAEMNNLTRYALTIGSEQPGYWLLRPGDIAIAQRDLTLKLLRECLQGLSRILTNAEINAIPYTNPKLVAVAQRDLTLKLVLDEINGEVETRQSLAEGHGITFASGEEAVKWLREKDGQKEKN